MRELNKNVLEQAVRELPQYTPPPEIWDRVEADLLTLDQDDSIAETVSELPEYAPPAFVWDQIEDQLNTKKKPIPVNGRIIPIGVRRMIAVAAAAVGVVMTVVFLNNNRSDTRITYSEEVIEEAVFVNDWDSDEEEFEIVLAELDDSDYIGQIPEVQNLKYELEELNEAKAEIELMMEQYGSDDDFIENMKEIELERTEVIKKLAAFI
ncbi:MAG: hypothetical protein DWQ02_10380 [Bacteroidetes bacterium]|nr:MAG: hypothetical protein DWQ02_10380 [Bacteroidota bacterium]